MGLILTQCSSTRTRFKKLNLNEMASIIHEEEIANLSKDIKILQQIYFCYKVIIILKSGEIVYVSIDPLTSTCAHI